jgi:hypothetical protein
MSDEINKNINPQITSVFVGTRDLREVQIYPLSLADELKFSDLITKEINNYFKSTEELGEEESNMAMAAAIVKMIKTNIPKLLDLVTDEPIKLSELTNAQAVEIASKIYDVNFDSLSKNVKSLSEKIKKVFQPERLTPLSVNDIPDTDLSTSVEDPIAMEELPVDS